MRACESSCSRMAGRRLLVRAQALERAHTTAGEPRCGRFQTTRPRPPLASDPDPLGATMKRVGEVLALYQKYGTHGVFWDFGSLMQHSPLPDGPRRTPEEQALFIEGLSASSLYYAHSETTVFRLTTWPQGYPDGYELAGANVAQYIDRGWCFSESCWSALTKDFAKSLDLGLYSGTKRRLHGTNGVLAECADSRHPPLLPGEFAKQLARKIFHNPEHDRPLVSKLYKQVFTEQLGKCTELDYHGMGWDDNEVTQLARVLASGAVPNLKTLNLSFNDFTDKGGVMLAKALAQALPELEVLEVKGMQLKKAIDPLRRAFSGRLIK
mmetsp:Transcript_62509/g.165402  ORF Transcript_62509/g.165402 Transcript_62509/m.165402 type:complete len:324 (-) Transcript_62509:264-1235(-)